MGLDYTALIYYRGPTEILSALASLEAGGGDSTFQEVIALGIRNDFAFANHAGSQAYWSELKNYEQKLHERPSLPSLQACLQLPSDFSLTFGDDTVWVYHTLRWIFFVTEAEWQRAVIAATKHFYELLGGKDCIITNDEHPAVTAFLSGASFEESLARSMKEGNGEVASIAEMYIDKGYADDLVYEGPEGQHYAIPLWDTHGFWRPFRLEGS